LVVSEWFQPGLCPALVESPGILDRMRAQRPVGDGELGAVELRLPGIDPDPVLQVGQVRCRSLPSGDRGAQGVQERALLVVYGLRLGEVLGLRWHDVDEYDGEVRIRQQVQRMSGQLRLYPLKTAASRRDLPLLPVVQSMLAFRRELPAADRRELGRAWQDNGLIFTTKTGRPVDPRNLLRSFRRICAQNSLRLIKVHHLRHTTATLLKNLGVPARDAQLILGHSRLAVTLEIYSHEDRQAQREALGRISDALGHGSPARVE
jgi:site-specific recombinase XerD